MHSAVRMVKRCGLIWMVLLLAIVAVDAQAQSRERTRTTTTRSSGIDREVKEVERKRSSRRAASREVREDRRRQRDRSSNEGSTSRGAQSTRSRTGREGPDERDGVRRDDVRREPASERGRRAASRPVYDDRSERTPRRTTVSSRGIRRTQPSEVDRWTSRAPRSASVDREVRRRVVRNATHRPDRYRHRRRLHRYEHHRASWFHKKRIVRPFIHIEFQWPWEHRYRHGWCPRYVYRQVVFYEADWRRRRYRSRIDVRTYYSHSVRWADRHRAEVDVFIDRIEIYDDGLFLGAVDYIPDHLGRIRATLYRDGHVEFDRDVFLVGDRYVGFELINTPFFDGYLMRDYRPSYGMRVGRIDLRHGEVHPVRYSRLFDPYDFSGFVPVSLLPDRRDWLFDYGFDSFSGAYYDYDPYYYGGYSDYGDGYDERDYYERDYYVDDAGRAVYGVRSAVDSRQTFYVEPMTATKEDRFQTQAGAAVVLKREAAFVRIQ